MIRIEHDDVELLLIHPVYKTKTFYRVKRDGTAEKFEKQVVVKELRVHRWFRREAIIGVQEYITSRNTIATNRCLVLDKFSNQFFAVFHSVSDVRAAIRIKGKNQIGF